MIVKDYIEQKFQPLSVEISEADLSDLSDSFHVNPEDEKSENNIIGIKKFMLKVISEKLDSLPLSVSESGFNMSWGDKRLYSFYNSLCSDLGIKNKYSTKAKVYFI